MLSESPRGKPTPCGPSSDYQAVGEATVTVTRNNSQQATALQMQGRLKKSEWTEAKLAAEPSAKVPQDQLQEPCLYGDTLIDLGGFG